MDEQESRVVNDEYVGATDPQGETKISPLGDLLGGRRFRVKTFKVPGKGEVKYAVSTDVARLIGYRDSYFLFQKHHFYRVICDDDAKMTLIAQGFLPGTFKTRSAYLITARAAFREFGARLIVGGRAVDDDYWESRSVLPRGTPVDPADEMASGGSGANSVAGAGLAAGVGAGGAGAGGAGVGAGAGAGATPLLGVVHERVGTAAGESWLLEAALACRTPLAAAPAGAAAAASYKDIHTGLHFVSAATQPTVATFARTGPSDACISTTTSLSLT